MVPPEFNRARCLFLAKTAPALAVSKETALRYDRSAELGGEDSLFVISQMIAPGSTVLDLGAATGKLGLHLRDRKGCTVDGVEFDSGAAALARPHYRKLLELDLRVANLGEHFPAGAYSAIVCADVLEHLADPGRVLDQLHSLLAQGGHVLISIPNVGYAGVIAGLLTGEFRYRPTGLLDSTHLRFFTRASLLELLADHGFGALGIRPIIIRPADSEFANGTLEKLSPSLLEAVLAVPDSVVYQFIVDAVPGPHEPRVGDLLRKPHLSSRVQAFWAGPGENFSEARGVTATVQMRNEPGLVELRLPEFSSAVARLRVDLSDYPGYLRLHQLRVESREGETLWDWDGNAHSLPSRHDLAHFSGPMGATWLSTAADPYIELPLPATALDQLSGSLVRLEISWPLSSDYALASSVLSVETARWDAERRALVARTSELEQLVRTTIERQGERLREEMAALNASRIAAEDQHANLSRRVSALELPRGIRFITRARANLLRPRFALLGVSRKDLVGEGRAWESIGMDPWFELTVPGDGPLPSGWVRIDFQIEPQTPFAQPPCLYVDSGEGYREGSRIILPSPQNGHIRGVVDLGPLVRSLRFDPLDRPGRFTIGPLRIQQIGRTEARLRLAHQRY
jgi:2-polyprenyl-3-methyl-5-hydroxy-6-metoxy-1,4-benzoquinol methylase